MEVYTSFDKATWQAFKSFDREGPIQMLNLIKLRDKAEYSAGFDTSGERAYAEYSRLSAPVLKRVGGRIVWRGAFELMMIGPQSESWDICFVAEYPSVFAFIEMIRDPAYQEASDHRTAAVADSRLVRLAAQDSGEQFYE
ncbi:DUF1330 domain-containing protein [Roseibium sp. HPY-6]|uniref:DUF1330 domain-containing protein n=1 Tax=Roseibium sp. HPY-6 TaxID=3229852 RepID=UPI00338E46F8